MTVKIGFTVKDDRTEWNRVLSNMAGANDQGVVTGIFKGDISEYAHHNEFGTIHIPKRPFMRKAFDQNEDSYLEMFKTMWFQQVGGELKSVRTHLVRIGVKARNDIIKTISRGGFERNAPTTVAAKRSSKPLVDTGDMQRAITFFVGNTKNILKK